ncbi:alpha/beta hydrolase [Litorimonas haliclonae]|uniref:alpha/beta hydrolase n=1 Tax=Litorimonas haliclonae TaxID=2081977 RepID=UPI0039F09F3D
MTNAPDFLDLSDGTRLAYRKTEGRSPTVVWCGGLKSDMEGSKATFLEDWAQERGQAFIRFDYFGHGASDGEFPDGTISRWASDTIAVIDALCDGKCVFVGSSMGGWAALLAGLERVDCVEGMVLINPAPDFTEKLTYAAWTEAQKTELEEQGVVYEPSGYEEPYAYSKAFIDDGRARQILDASIALKCPIRILQGAEDSVVPPKHSQKIVEAVESQDVTYTLVKGADHSLSREQDLKLLAHTLNELLG